jgi:hypothetical protein
MDITPTFHTVPQLAAKFPAFTEGGLRWLVFNAKYNGFQQVIVRVGRRVLIDETRFVEWLRNQRQGG